MKTLFLDTTYNQILGLLDSDMAWLGKVVLDGQKCSSLLHANLHRLMEQLALKPSDINQIIYVAGPGFYTGLRLSYGIAEILGLESRAVLNFYSFEVPKFLGSKKYTWFTKAYRGEVFVYEHDTNTAKEHLMTVADFLARKWTGELYIHHGNAVDEELMINIPQAVNTEALMIDQLSVIVGKVKESIAKRELFYFRPLEQEFKPSI